MPLNQAEARSYLSTPEPRCTNCGHAENDHSSGPCHYFDETDDGNITECTCGDFRLFQEQPLDVDFPLGATLEDLRFLPKVATQDGRLIPIALSREIGKRFAACDKSGEDVRTIAL